MVDMMGQDVGTPEAVGHEAGVPPGDDGTDMQQHMLCQNGCDNNIHSLPHLDGQR